MHRTTTESDGGFVVPRRVAAEPGLLYRVDVTGGVDRDADDDGDGDEVDNRGVLQGVFTGNQLLEAVTVTPLSAVAWRYADVRARYPRGERQPDASG